MQGLESLSLVSEQSERSLLAILLKEPSYVKKVKSIVDTEDFNDEAVRYLYSYILRFSDNEKEYTWEEIAGLVSKEQKRPIKLEHPLYYISQLVILPINAESYGLYIAKILEVKKRKELIGISDKLSKSLLDVSRPIDSFYTDVKKLNSKIIENGNFISKVRDITSSNLWEEFQQDITKLYNTKFVGTGWGGLDKHLAWGFAPGQVSIITGRMGMGKSTFRANLMKSFAEREIFTITISIEQSISQEYFRLISMYTGIPVLKLARVREWIDSEDQDIYNKFIETVKRMSGQVDDGFGGKVNWPHRLVKPSGMFSLSDVVEIITDSKKKNEDPRIIFIDLFAQLDDISMEENNQTVVIAKKVNEVAQIANEFQVHICLVIQLKRLGTRAKNLDHREYVYGSDAYMQRADLAFRIERAAYYRPDQVQDNSVSVHIMKNRDGPMNNVRLAFNPETLCISDIKEEQEVQTQNNQRMENPKKESEDFPF